MPDQDHIDTGEYLSAIWRRRMVIGIVTIACAAAAFGLAMLQPRQYRATVVLAVTQPNLPEGQAATLAARFRPLLQSPNIAREVVRTLGLDKPPDNLTTEQLLSNVIQTEEIRGTNLIQLNATFRDPALAARIAEEVAVRASELTHTLGVSQQAWSRDVIKKQLDQAKVRLDQSETALMTYRNQAQIEALKSDVAATLGERGKLLELLVSIEREKAKLATLEKELTQRSRVDTFKRTIDEAPALAEAARRGTGASVAGMQMSSEWVNTVYQELDTAVATSKGTLSALEKQKAELINVRKLDAAVLPLLNRLYEREAELSRRQVERDLAERVYTDISQRYEVTRLEIAGRSAELQVIDPPAVPDRPLPRQVLRNTALAGFGGFGFACLFVVFGHAVRLARPRGDR